MIDILMATYNGEKYIEEQINSILSQTYSSWKLYIRDDGSTDNTVDILKKFKHQYPKKIILVKDQHTGLGAKMNFAELLKYSTSEYCMFSDQDDVWLDNKISLCLNKMKEAEKKYGKSTPILVNTDLKVVNEDGNIINDSFWKYQQLNGECIDINKLIVENNVTGCTMFMNKSLVKYSLNIPNECVMHDWWIALIASAIGKRVIVNEGTILYRQHGNNEVGAKDAKSLGFLLSKFNKNEINKSINKSILQAEKFYQIYGDKLNQDDKIYLERFVNIRNEKLINRKMIAINNGFYKNSLKRRLGYLLFI